MRLFATRLTAIAATLRRAWSPSSLFSASEPGAWYDPSDMSTLFQDSAGTVPVTAVEQPVGLMLDKSKGPVLGAELYTGPANITVAPATEVVVATTVIGKWYLVYIPVGCQGNFGPGWNATSSATGLHYRLADGTGFRIRNFGASDTAVFTPTIKLLPGNHATQATAAKRPILKQDGNGKYYLLFDGVDDALATGSIDFSATDKMTVFAGVRKLSDAAIGALLELSIDPNSSLGAFRITTGNPANTYELTSKGSLGPIAALSPLTYTPPITNVLTGLLDIGGDAITLRINGAQVATSAGNQGTGNYGNYPLYIGSRGGTTRPFNGQLYSLIVRGAQSTDAQIVSAETYVNSKTGAY